MMRSSTSRAAAAGWARRRRLVVVASTALSPPYAAAETGRRLHYSSNNNNNHHHIVVVATHQPKGPPPPPRPLLLRRQFFSTRLQPQQGETPVRRGSNNYGRPQGPPPPPRRSADDAQNPFRQGGMPPPGGGGGRLPPPVTPAAAAAAPLPWHHSRKDEAPVCRAPLDVLIDDVTEHCLNVPVGHLFSFVDKEQQQDYPPQILRDRERAWERADAEWLQRVEYWMRGLALHVPGTLAWKAEQYRLLGLTTDADKERGAKGLLPPARPVSPAKAHQILTAMQALVERLEREGQAYLQVRAERGLEVRRQRMAQGYSEADLQRLHQTQNQIKPPPTTRQDETKAHIHQMRLRYSYMSDHWINLYDRQGNPMNEAEYQRDAINARITNTITRNPLIDLNDPEHANADWIVANEQEPASSADDDPQQRARVAAHNEMQAQLYQDAAQEADEDEEDALTTTGEDKAAAAVPLDPDQAAYQELLTQFASPGVTTEMYATLLDAMAVTAPLVEFSDQQPLANFFGIFDEDGLRTERLVQQVVERDELDSGGGGGGGLQQPNRNVWTVPTVACFNAAVRVSAQLPAVDWEVPHDAPGVVSDKKRLRDHALAVAMACLDHLQHCPHSLLECNAATYVYVLQTYNRYLPHSELKANCSLAVWAQAAIHEKVATRAVVQHLVACHTPSHAAYDPESERYLETHRLRELAAAADNDDNDDARLPKEWSSAARYKRYQRFDDTY